MSNAEQDLVKRISVDAHTSVTEESSERVRLLRATGAILRLVSLTDPISPEAEVMRSALEAAGVTREGESLDELHAKAMTQIEAATVLEEGIVAAAQRNIDFMQGHSLELSE